MHIGIDLRALMTPMRTGVGEFAFELLNALFAIDETNDYYLFYNSSGDVSKNIPRWNKPNVHYVSTRWPNKLLNASLFFLKKPVLDKSIIGNFDVWFSPNLNFTALTPGTKHILTIHDLSFEFFPEFFTPRQRFWHRLVNPKKQCAEADIILTPSENTKRDLVDYYKINADKIKVLYPGTNCHFEQQRETSFQSTETPRDSSFDVGMTEKKDEIKKKYDLPDNFILFLGTIEPRKNIIGLIEAFELAHQTPNIQYQISDYHLVIAGAPGWNNQAIYERAAASPLRDHIKFIGFIKPEEKPALYAAASLFVYPSFFEGFGFPVLEAMASGVPVVTSNRTSLPEITGSAAYLVNPNKPHEIAEGIARLLNHNLCNPSHHQRNLCQQKNGLEEAKKFNWNQTAHAFLNLLKN